VTGAGTGVLVTAQRAFSLVELMVAAAIAAMLSWVLVSALHATIVHAAHLDARLTSRASIDRLTDRLNGDAASAWSVFVPGTDVLGAKNADGHEIDFVSESASRDTYWWAYTFDATNGRVTKYTYVPGAKPIAGDAFDSIDGFAAELHPVTDVATASSDVYDPLFASANATAVNFDFGWPAAAAAGGNHLVRIELTGTGIDRTLLLASATAPSHFTVIVNYTPPPATPAP
jgi:prepilin-type N-terminal cleavage/methylation domain-containing protein